MVFRMFWIHGSERRTPSADVYPGGIHTMCVISSNLAIILAAYCLLAIGLCATFLRYTGVTTVSSHTFYLYSGHQSSREDRAHTSSFSRNRIHKIKGGEKQSELLSDISPPGACIPSAKCQSVTSLANIAIWMCMLDPVYAVVTQEDMMLVWDSHPRLAAVGDTAFW